MSSLENKKNKVMNMDSILKMLSNSWSLIRLVLLFSVCFYSCDISNNSEYLMLNDNKDINCSDSHRDFLARITGKTFEQIEERSSNIYTDSVGFYKGDDFSRFRTWLEGCPDFSITDYFSDKREFAEESGIMLNIENYEQIIEELGDIENFNLKLARWNNVWREGQDLQVLFFYYNKNYYAISLSFIKDDN